MRFRLSTLLFVIPMIALTVALSLKNSKPKIITIENYVDWWILNEKQVAQSLWQESGNPPPIQFRTAFSIATELVAHLERNSQIIKHDNFAIEKIALVRIDPEASCWVYEISISSSVDGKRGWLELSVLLLMDVTLAVDPNGYWEELVAVIQKFDEERDIELVVAGHE